MAHRLWFVSLLVVVFSMVGCQNDRVLLYVRYGTLTPSSTQEPTALTFTPTLPSPPTTTATTTIIPPTPTLTPPTITPTLAPLSATGPWLVYQQDSPIDGRSLLYVANSDGTGIISIPLIEEETILRWKLHHHYIVVFTKDFEGQEALKVFEIPSLRLISALGLTSTHTSEAAIIYGYHYIEAEEPIWSPTACQFAFTARRDSAYPQTYLFDCASGEVSALRQEDVANMTVAWSPDGQWLVYYREDNTHPIETPSGALTYNGDLWLYNLTTQEHRLIPLERTHYSFDVRWVSDSLLLLAPLYPDGGNPGPLYSYDVVSQQTTLLYNVGVQAMAEGSTSNYVIADVYGDSTNTACNGWNILEISTPNCTPLSVYAHYSVPWFNALQLWGTQNETGTWQFFNEKGEVVHTYSALPDMRSVTISPDNRLVLFSSDSHTGTSYLFTVAGDKVATVEGMQNVIWLDNGTVLLATEYGAEGLRLVTYRDENNWQRNVVVEGLPYNTEIVAP